MRTPYTYNDNRCHIAKSEAGNPLTKFVNLIQSPEERRDKYSYCRLFGLSSYQAMQLRDWHWTKINLYVGACGKEPTQLLSIITPDSQSSAV